MAISVKATKDTQVRMKIKYKRRKNPVRVCNVRGNQRHYFRRTIETRHGRNEVGETIAKKTLIKQEEDACSDEPYNGTNCMYDNNDDNLNEREAIKRESIPNIQLTREMLVKYNMTIMPPRFVTPKWTPMYPR